MNVRKTLILLGTTGLVVTVAFTLGARQAKSQSALAHQLTAPPTGYTDAYMTYSPDGSRIAFYRIAPGGVPTDLCGASAASGATSVLVPFSQLPSDLAQAGGIVWSPDGNHIAICAGRPEAIWMVDLVESPVSATPTTWGQVKSTYRK